MTWPYDFVMADQGVSERDIQYWSDGRCVYGEVNLGLHGLWRTATAISDRDPMLCRTVGLAAAMDYTQEVMERTVSEVLRR